MAARTSVLACLPVIPGVGEAAGRCLCSRGNLSNSPLSGQRWPGGVELRESLSSGL